MGILRFLLALVVVLFHNVGSFWWLMDSHTAVKIFFIISGFYMALILNQKYGSASGGLRAFAINRFLRLYPLYAAVLILTIGWYLLRLAMIGGRTPIPGIFEIQPYLSTWQTIAIWLSNVSLIGLDFICSWDLSPTEGLNYLPFPHPATDTTTVNLGSAVWVIQAWSISMEILFYVSAPFLARLKTVTLAGIIIASFALDVWLSSGLGRVTYFFAPAQLYLFATGMMLYRTYSSLNLAETVVTHRSWMTMVAAVLFFLAWGLPLFNPSVPQSAQLLCFALLIPTLFAISKDARWDRALGNLSYPIYLSHMLVGGVLAVAFKRLTVPDGLATPLMLASCILVAVILHRIVESPIEGLRAAISRKLTRTH
jgi:peptidoglycan/LPS O-acetylase OafA/YrhL